MKNEIPKDFIRRFNRGTNFVVNDCRIYAPTVERKTWRVKSSFAGKSIERSGGSTVESLFKAFQDVDSKRKLQLSRSEGYPELENALLSKAIQEFLDAGGLHGKWKPKTLQNRKSTLAKAIEITTVNNWKCEELNPTILREFLRCASTLSVAKTLKSTLKTFLKWGVEQGYFSIEQSHQIDFVSWTADRRRAFGAGRTRRELSEEIGLPEGQTSGQVPTHAQVSLIAKEVQKRYKHGEALIHLAANTGLRSGELLFLTASDVTAQAKMGNLVYLPEFELHVIGQKSQDPSCVFAPTKSGKSRKVVVPRVESIATGFNLRAWLQIRCEEALREQDLGLNPLALIFPNRGGTYLDPSNFGSRVIRPSMANLGFALPEYQTATGASRRMMRFTLHSMRDRYALTAIEEWKYTETQLLAQGSWEDPETVRKFYLGTPDETLLEVKRIHNSEITLNSNLPKGY